MNNLSVRLVEMEMIIGGSLQTPTVSIVCVDGHLVISSVAGSVVLLFFFRFFLNPKKGKWKVLCRL